MDKSQKNTVHGTSIQILDSSQKIKYIKEQGDKFDQRFLHLRSSENLKVKIHNV